MKRSITIMYHIRDCTVHKFIKRPKLCEMPLGWETWVRLTCYFFKDTIEIDIFLYGFSTSIRNKIQ